MPALEPRNGPQYVVRWLRTDGQATKHRYFRRDVDARRFLDRLIDGGWTARLYVTDTHWKEAR